MTPPPVGGTWALLHSTLGASDAELGPGRSPASSGVPLSPERVVAAALEYVDQEGLPGLTMRRLGERLGVEAMSLYRYVPGKKDLRGAMVESLVSGMEDDQEVLLVPRDGWQDLPQRLTHGVHRVALAHPRVWGLNYSSRRKWSGPPEARAPDSSQAVSPLRSRASSSSR